MIVRWYGAAPKLLPGASFCIGALAAMLALTAPAQASAACKLPQLAEIQLEMAGASPRIEGEINGQKVTLLADTGASSSALFRPFVSRLGLHELQLRGITYYGTGGSSAAGYVNIASIKLGGFSGRGMPMLVLGEGAHLADGPAGAVGADFWGKADDEFDLAHKVVRMLKPEGCSGDELVYWGGGYSVANLQIPSTTQNEFVVTVMLDGVPLRAQLDTGASTSVVTRQGATKLRLEWPKPEKGDGDFVGLGKATVPQTRVQFKEFAFDQEKIKNPKIYVADIFGQDREVQLGSRALQDVALFPDMILGADFFLAHRVLISNSQRKVYISYNGAKLF